MWAECGHSSGRGTPWGDARAQPDPLGRHRWKQGLRNFTANCEMAQGLLLFCFSIYKAWGFRNKPLSIIKYPLLEQVALSNHRNPPHALFWCYKILAVCATARPSKPSLKSNKDGEQTHLWLGLQSEGFVCSWSPVCSCLSRLWVIGSTCSFPLLQMHMHRLLADQGCLQCCQTQAGPLLSSLCCS